VRVASAERAVAQAVLVVKVEERVVVAEVEATVEEPAEVRVVAATVVIWPFQRKSRGRTLLARCCQSSRSGPPDTAHTRSRSTDRRGRCSSHLCMAARPTSLPDKSGPKDRCRMLLSLWHFETLHQHTACI
jgi:hypothetical protein